MADKWICVLRSKPIKLTVRFRGYSGFEVSMVGDTIALGETGQGCCGRAVQHGDWYAHELYVAVAVPDQQFAAARDVPARLVVDFTITALCTAVSK